VKFTLGRIPYEDEHKVVAFRRFLPDRGREGKGLVQFYALRGGLRTVDVSDIVGTR
jgi:hypothetical protein